MQLSRYEVNFEEKIMTRNKKSDRQKVAEVTFLAKTILTLIVVIAVTSLVAALVAAQNFLWTNSNVQEKTGVIVDTFIVPQGKGAKYLVKVRYEDGKERIVEAKKLQKKQTVVCVNSFGGRFDFFSVFQGATFKIGRCPKID